MKKLIIILFSVVNVLVFAQKLASVEKSVTGIQVGFLGVDLYNESRISDKFVVRSQFTLNPSIWGGNFYDKTGFALTPEISVSSKYYYNISSRAEQGKNTSHNSANYIASITGFSMQSFPKLMQDDIVIENFGNSSTADLIGLGLAQANRHLTSYNLNKYFWGTTINELKDFWLKIGKTPSTVDNKITLFRKYPAFGKVLIHKAYYETKFNDNEAEKTFDFGGEIKIGWDQSQNGLSVAPGTTIKKPEDFMIRMYGIVKRNGQWHGSKIDNTL